MTTIESSHSPDMSWGYLEPDFSTNLYHIFNPIFHLILFPDKRAPVSLSDTQSDYFEEDFSNWHQELRGILDKDTFSRFEIESHLKKPFVVEWLSKEFASCLEQDIAVYASLIALPTLLKRVKGDVDLIPSEFTEELSQVSKLKLVDQTITPDVLVFLKALKNLEELRLPRCTFQEIDIENIRKALPSDCSVSN